MTTSNTPSTARIWADIDLSAVLSNARTVEHAVSGGPGTRLLPMVKAGGYGVGAVPVARILERLDPWGFGVATLAEGVELRMAGINRPVVVFTPLQQGTTPLYAEHNLRPAIGDPAALAEWVQAGTLPFHVEIDTGMGRSGFRWDGAEDIARLAALLGPASGWEGLFTHFHSVDESPGSVTQQWQRFMQVLPALPRRPALVHAANSGAALRHPEVAGDLVRPGIFLYGGEAGGRYPSPVVMLQARVIAVRRLTAGDTVSYGAAWTAGEPTTVATLGAGYADGIHRALGNRGRVELSGMVVPIAGRVTMDMTMVALPAGTPVAPGDVATIIGGRVPLDLQAAAADTIAYELLTSMSARVERRYRE